VPRAVLLDLDRTLVDMQSYTDYDAAWDAVRAAHPDLVVDEGPDTGWTSSTRACMGTLAALPDGPLWYDVSTTVSAYERAAMPHSVTMPGAAQFVPALAGRPVAVVTLLPADVARDVLHHHGLGIDVVVGRDPRVRPKPAGDGLLEALRLLGETVDCAVMVGDSTWDAGAARDAGMAFIGVHAGPSEFARDFRDVPVVETLADVLVRIH
jgi:HAD superfamily hydrolase (TIGR01509 family)